MKMCLCFLADSLIPTKETSPIPHFPALQDSSSHTSTYESGEDTKNVYSCKEVKNILEYTNTHTHTRKPCTHAHWKVSAPLRHYRRPSGTGQDVQTLVTFRISSPPNKKLKQAHRQSSSHQLKKKRQKLRISPVTLLPLLCRALLCPSPLKGQRSEVRKGEGQVESLTHSSVLR